MSTDGRSGASRRGAAPAAVAVLAAVAVAATGCGSSGSGGPASGAAAGQAVTRPHAPGPAGDLARPYLGPLGGRITAVGDGTAQLVASAGAQLTVSWASTTRFTTARPVHRRALSVGDCVAATPSGRRSPFGHEWVTRLTVVEAARCRPGPPAGLPGRLQPGSPGATPPAPPTPGSPQTMQPFGTATAAPAALRPLPTTLTVGRVVRVLPHAVAVRPVFGSGEIVALTPPGTAYLAEQPATAAAMVVGRCAAVVGVHADAGPVVASSIEVSAPVGGRCPPTVAPVPGIESHGPPPSSLGGG